MDRNALIKALRDTAQSASNTIASGLSGPVDLIAAGLRMGGLPIDNPVGGSQWLEQRGLTRPVEQGVPQVIGETLGMVGPALVAAKAPQIASGLMRIGENAMAPRTLNAGTIGKQRGALAWHGKETKNNLDADYLQDLISSQRYIDRDIVAKKIKEGDFDVRVTPHFEVDGEQVRAIQDGHHALEAAIRSGNRPNFIENTAQENDRISLLNAGKVDDFLQAAYHDSPWYRFAKKLDIW